MAWRGAQPAAVSTPHQQDLGAGEAGAGPGCGQGRQEVMHQALGTVSCSHGSAPSLHTSEGAGRVAWGAIPGEQEEEGGTAWQHLLPQPIQPQECHSNVGLGTARANVSRVKCLQRRADVLKSLAPRSLRCKPCCQSLPRIPAPTHCQDSQLFEESDLATAPSIYGAGQHGGFWGHVCHTRSCRVFWPPSRPHCLP